MVQRLFEILYFINSIVVIKFTVYSENSKRLPDIIIFFNRSSRNFFFLQKF